MTGTRKKTKILMIVSIAGWIVWDIYVAIGGDPGTGDTISRITLVSSMALPIIPAAVGIVVGHLFWPQRSCPKCPHCKRKSDASR